MILRKCYLKDILNTYIGRLMQVNRVDILVTQHETWTNQCKPGPPWTACWSFEQESTD